jgi:hypothetical protein
MAENVRLERRSGEWHVLALHSAGIAAEAAWVSIGGCRSQLVAVRLWLAVLARGERS